MTLTPAGLAAVLTGLRILQTEIEKHGEPLGIYMDIFNCGGEVTPLTSEQINDLCMMLNISDTDD